MHLTMKLKLTIEPRNFYSSSFAQPLPEAQRLEAMNAKVYNANELALSTVHWH